MMSTSAYDVARQTLLILLPEILLLLTATVMMTAAAFVRLARTTWVAVSTVALGLALIVLLGISQQSVDPYSAVALNDALSQYARLVLLLSGLIVLAMAHDQVDSARAGEFFGSLLIMDAGAMLVAASNELVFLFAGLELVSIPTYLLLYLPRRSATTQEAATKYFFLSIFSSGLLLFGLAYLYGLCGVSNMKALAFLANRTVDFPQPQLGLLAVVFVIAGLGFRVAAVPFHFYAPDVYQGSPTVLAALLSWVPKAIGFLAMLRTVTPIVSAAGPGPLAHQAVLLAWIIAVVTMTLGNTVALAQDNLRRLLAYSSIAHAGYLMIGVALAFQNDPDPDKVSLYLGGEGILFYLTAYALMTLGAFGVIVLLSTPERPVDTIDQLAGLARTRPVSALAMAVCLFSLAGIPPLAGFWGKFELFAAAFAASVGADGRLFWWLAVIAVLNSAVGAYYYLRIVVGMYLRDPVPGAEPLSSRPAWPTALAVTACAGLTIFFGLLPAPVARATREAAVAAVSIPDPEGDSQARPVTALRTPSAR
jgi:NADH-quinone oxidoreductase subunit N